MAKINYTNVLDLVALFNSETDLKRFSEGFVKHLLEEHAAAEKSELNKEHAIMRMPFVRAKDFGYNIDISVLAEYMGLFVGSKKVIEDLMPTYKDKAEKKKGLVFFYNHLLSKYLSFLFMGDAKSVYDYKNYYTPIIYNFGANFVYNAVCVNKKFLSKYVRSELMEQLEKLASLENDNVVAFGLKGIEEFKKNSFTNVRPYAKN